jgi:hypothetical protein
VMRQSKPYTCNVPSRISERNKPIKILVAF